VTTVRMLYFESLNNILILHGEGEIQFVIWSEISAIKTQWLLVMPPALIQMLVISRTACVLCVSYGSQKSDSAIMRTKLIAKSRRNGGGGERLHCLRMWTRGGFVRVR
jgi:hypothetical protein